MKVIEHHNQRLPDGKALDQVTDRAVGAEALRRGGWLVAPGIERAQCGKHPRELAQILCGQAVELTRIKRFEVLVERVNDDAERKLSLELGGAATESKAATLLGLTNELEQQARLTDPGLARDEHEAWVMRARLLEQLPEQLQLAVSADEGLSHLTHDESVPGSEPTCQELPEGIFSTRVLPRCRARPAAGC